MFDTSSAVFEYGLVKALNKICDLHIINLSSNNLKAEKIKQFSFSSIKYNSLLGFFRLAIEILRNKNINDFNILTTGYYPFEIGTVVMLSRALGGKSFCYIYDTHYKATSVMPFIKKLMANFYFFIGFSFAKKSSGLLVLNESFIKKYSINTPYLKTRVGVNCDVDGVELNGNKAGTSSNINKKIIIFAGTINSENGARLLTDFLNQNKFVQFEMHFYGDGEDADIVRELEKIDNRVKYFGRIPEKLLKLRLLEADFLINLRDPNGHSVDYSFPSKLISFMSTGTPVISNNFPGLDSCYFGYLHLIDEYSVDSLSKKIINLLENVPDKNIGLAAKSFVCKQNNWDEVSKNIIEFMGKLNDG